MKDSFFRTFRPLPAFITLAAITAALALLIAAQSSSGTTVAPPMAEPTGISKSSPDSETPVSSGSAYVGYRHKGVLRGRKLPNGVRDLGGGLLSDENYGVTRYSKADKYMLWLEQILEYDNNGTPTWEVKDVLVFDKLKKNQMFLYSYSSPCTADGAENLDLIVKVEENRKRKTYTVLKAWLANVDTERFEETTINSVVCPHDIQ